MELERDIVSLYRPLRALGFGDPERLLPIGGLHQARVHSRELALNKRHEGHAVRFIAVEASLVMVEPGESPDRDRARGSCRGCKTQASRRRADGSREAPPRSPMSNPFRRVR